MGSYSDYKAERERAKKEDKKRRAKQSPAQRDAEKPWKPGVFSTKEIGRTGNPNKKKK